VVDMRMPGMSGLELQRIIAGTSHDRPVVFVTGHGDEALRREAMARGAVDVLFKPLDGDVLLDAIARALERVVPGAALARSSLTRSWRARPGSPSITRCSSRGRSPAPQRAARCVTR